MKHQSDPKCNEEASEEVIVNVVNQETNCCAHV